MQGRVAIVTGAGSGIGRARALAFARAGAQGVADINLSGAKEAAHQVEQVGSRALALQVDVGRAPEVERLVQQTLAVFSRLDMLPLTQYALPIVHHLLHLFDLRLHAQAFKGGERLAGPLVG